MQKLIFLDTETTGTDRQNSGVWQIGGIIECGKRKEEFLFECDVFECDILDPEVEKVTGITLEKLSKMEDPGKTHDEFIALLDKYVNRYDKKDKFHFINYRVDFDEDMLIRWFKNNDDDYFFSWFWHPGLCMMHAANVYLQKEREELRNFKMDTVAEYLGIKIDATKQHNALYDATIAMEIYNKIVRK